MTICLHFHISGTESEQFARSPHDEIRHDALHAANIIVWAWVI